MTSTSIPLNQFQQTFGRYVELSSAAVGAAILDVSNDFFADATNLLKINPAQSFPGQFGPKGSLMDGWESRRHCKTHDWVIIKLAALCTVIGMDLDTSWFDGNEAPAASVLGASVPSGSSITRDSTLWSEILSPIVLGPSSRHLFKLTNQSFPVTHLMLRMHPDGGIARFRVYGTILPQPSKPDCSKAVDLAFVLNGGTVQGKSDEHYGVGSYILLPGRGVNMEDGWHTKRSRNRVEGEGDWIVIKLGEAGWLEWVDIDTKDFIGNFPESVELYGIHSKEMCPPQDAPWTLILTNQETKEDQHHYYPLLHHDASTPFTFTHVRLNIYPDGGLKRVRVYGRKVSDFPDFATLTPLSLSDVSEV